MKQIALEKITLPTFQTVDEPAMLPAKLYQERLARLREQMQKNNLDFICIYSDREHAANFEYFAGFEPRFEEGLLLIPTHGDIHFFLGNESLSMPSFFTKVPHQSHIFSALSLLNQPRTNSYSLSDKFRELGVQSNSYIGLIGWKYYEQDDYQASQFEVPHFLVATLEQIVSDRSQLSNQTALLMHPHFGLRTFTEVEQIAIYEYSAYLAAKSVFDVQTAAAPGVSELTLGQKIQDNGLPRGCHPMISFGEKGRLGLPSPANFKAQKGDFITCAVGIAGALSARGAFIDDIHADGPAKQWLNQVAIPYVQIAYEWFKQIKIGLKGGDLYQFVETHYPKSVHGWSLNPGHFIGYDEWVSSPFYAGSDIKVKSGSYFQFDLIASHPAPLFGGNMEDGVYIADAALREQIKTSYPEMFKRMQARREYMKTLGYELDESVLPMSDMTGYLRPLLLSPEYALVIQH